MEKVVCICEITGKVTVIADGVTTEEAKKIIREKSQENPYGDYRRVVKV